MARLLVFAVIILLPLSFVRVDQRGTALNTLVIQLDRSSPAFAAFDDLREEFIENTFDESRPLRQVTLTSGKVYIPKTQIVPESPSVLRITLNTMKIQRSMSSFEDMNLAQNKLESKIDWENNESLPTLSDRKKILMAEVSREDLLAPSASEMAAELVKKSLSMETPGKKELSTEAGGVIVVKKPGSDRGVEERSPYVDSYDYSVKSNGKVAPGKTDRGNETPNEGVFLTGSVLVDGVGGTRWRVYRVLNGQTLESGSIDILGAQFKIRVRERKGIVVAEVGDEFGKVSGRGQVSLENRVDLALNVRPVEDEAATISATSPAFSGASSAKKPTIAASYNIFGSTINQITSGKALDVSSYSEDSRILVEVEAPHQLASLAIGFLSRLKSISLYSVKSIKAFYQIVRSFYRPIDIQNYALFWGKVVKGGQPVVGAQVELASNEGKLIYFNEIGIPRSGLDKTTALGQFAVVNVPQGIQSLRVRYMGEIFPAQVIPSSNGKITNLQLEIPNEFYSHDLRVHSLLEPEVNLPVTGRILGLDSNYDLESIEQIKLPAMEAGITMEFDGGPGFELLRVHLPQLVGQTAMGFPMVPYSWVDELLRSAGKTLDRRLGWAIGFSESGDEEVQLLGQNDEFHQIIYFDKDHKLSAGSATPPGGGFLAFNLPLGFQSLEVRGINAPQSIVESFVSEPYFLYLIGSKSFIKPLGQENF